MSTVNQPTESEVSIVGLLGSVAYTCTCQAKPSQTEGHKIKIKKNKNDDRGVAGVCSLNELRGAASCFASC